MLTMKSLNRAFAKRVGRSCALACALTILLGAALGSSRHPLGTLKLLSKTFRAGDSLAVGGAKFSTNDEVTIALVGVAGRIELGAVPTDTAGAFQHSFLVPASVKGGQYRLVAEAIDGDAVASLDVAVQPASAAAPMVMMPGETMPAGMSMESHPTGEPLQLTRASNPAVTWSARLFVLACALAGAALLRRDSNSILTENQK